MLNEIVAFFHEMKGGIKLDQVSEAVLYCLSPESKEKTHRCFTYEKQPHQMFCEHITQRYRGRKVELEIWNFASIIIGE
jgi:hypothetical protein